MSSPRSPPSPCLNALAETRPPTPEEQPELIRSVAYRKVLSWHAILEMLGVRHVESSGESDSEDGEKQQPEQSQNDEDVTWSQKSDSR